MRIGIFVAYWPWFTPEEQVELAVQADELGLDCVWVSEAWGQDAVSVLGLLAGRTARVGLGSGLMQIPARAPAATAMAAASLDVLSGGRFRLGLGVSGPQVSEGWYGVPFTRPLRRTREYVEIVRAALARDRGGLTYEGEEWQLPLPAGRGMGLGKPLRLLARPVQERVPIYLGSIGPRSVEQTGAIADGWLPFLLHPERAEEMLDPLRRGAEAAGRSLEEIDISPVVPAAVAETVEEAREAVRPWLAFYLGAMGAKQKNFYVEAAARYGYGESAREVQDRFLAGDRAGAVAALDLGLVEEVAICTTPDGLADRVRRFFAAGATSLTVVPSGDKAAVVTALGEVAAAAGVGG